MPDEIEQHLALTEVLETAAIARARDALREQAARPALEDCEDCGRPIPAARRAAMPGVTRCVPCQSMLEENS